jgi:hypothetical protein
MEIAQPNRLDEVLEEMVRRDVAVKTSPGRWELVED